MRHGSTPVNRATFQPRSARVATAVLLLAAAATAHAQLSVQQALLLRGHGLALVSDDSSTPPPPPATTEAALHALADEAALIFVGEVLTVQPDGNAMRIDIRVDDGIRGVLTGTTFSLREWTGLWAADTVRYHAGQRALFFLHAPSVAGFTSPVGGSDGVVALAGDEVSAAADLRWIAARVQRTIASRAENAPDGTIASANTVYPATGRVSALATKRASATANGIAWPADAVNGNVLGPDLHSIDRNLVTGLLRAWAPGSNATAGAH